MAALINVGGLVLTPDQLKRAIEQDLTVEETIQMIEADKTGNDNEDSQPNHR